MAGTPPLANPAPGTTLILVGAHSRAAAAIRRRLGSRFSVIGIARQAGPDVAHIVGDYAAVPADLPLEGATIVNCVGTDRGTVDELDRLNVAVPRAWAAAARDRGARHFVQLSSFSVYGRAERIARETPLAPVSDYGGSKLAAERALTELGGNLAISLLRVPILLAPAGPGGTGDKLAQLAALVKRLHVVPRPARRVERSMISYDGLAAAVEKIIAARPATACAADPEPFTYDLLADTARRCGVSAISLPVPGFASALVRRAAPALGERLFASSLLADEDNLLAGQSDFTRLRAVVASHFA